MEACDKCAKVETHLCCSSHQYHVSFVQAQNQEFKGFIHTSLEWIIRTGQDVGIRLYTIHIIADHKPCMCSQSILNVCVCACLQTDRAGSWWSSDWCVWDLSAGVHTSQNVLHMPLPPSFPHSHQQSFPHHSWWDKSYHIKNSWLETWSLDTLIDVSHSDL